MDLKCTNGECPQHDVVIANPSDFAPEEVICGECNGPVVGVEAEP